MSSPPPADDDETEDVEFVSEGPVRPVSECIDLLSDSEDEGCSSAAGTVEDKISRHKARVTSTLDRLERRVALENKERSDKCRAFKEKQILQRAHGQRELALNSTNGVNREARHCVDMWLKMPGLQPGMIGGGFGRRRRPASFPGRSSTRHVCPVINCGRVYDNTALLNGHLKRFDHSPCDPTINLKGCPSDVLACVACGQCFQTEESWRTHLESKVSSSPAGGHSIAQTYQRIVCFACPACYFLFNLRDECLQHMSANNHFTESLPLSEPRGRAAPVPVSQYVKNRLITLCKDATFSVQCSLCRKALTSHQVAQAHFNVHCRQGCAVAKADKTVVQVMKQLQVRGQCALCCQLFHSQADIERHKESTQHDVEVNQTMNKALLQYCRFSEIQHTQQRKRPSAGQETPSQKRTKTRSDCDEFPAKRQKANGGTSRTSATAWFCECGIRFSEEAAASQHLLAVNQIFHQCGVCGKRMGESSITRLHMCRFHGGAHLSNFLFYCRKCKVEMPRHEDIMSHVSDAHRGHTYFAEQEVPEEVPAVVDAEPSTSCAPPASPPPRAAASWMCRMCEDVFDTEAAVRQHCGDTSSHSFQRFVCGHCPQKFFKESTVRRHCADEHGGQMKSARFCGLCDSMRFESEAEFLGHYESLHSKDYFCMDEAVQPAARSPRQCPCMTSDKSTGERKATYTRCMRSLSDDGKCLYVCAPCGVSVASYAQMKTHVRATHAALNLDQTFEVECKACRESFAGVPSFHKHYHSRHCALQPCTGSRSCSRHTAARNTTAQVATHSREAEDETPVGLLKMDQSNAESEAGETGLLLRTNLLHPPPSSLL